MRLSNKSTFSLASLIVLLALGLVFVGTSVMAHDGTHPLNEDIAEDADADIEAVTAHNAHPTPTISLKSGQANVRGTDIVIVEDDGDTADVTENQFTLIVDFGETVANVNSMRIVTDPTSADDAVPLLESEIAEIVLNTLGVTESNAVTIGAPTRVALDDPATMWSKSKFEVVVTVNDFPSGTADAADKTLTFRAKVIAGAAFSLETQPGVLTADIVPGGESLASDTVEFTLVNAFPAGPTNVAPTITIAFVEADSDENSAVFTVTLADDTDAAGDITFDITKISATNGTIAGIVPSGNGVFRVTVTPTISTSAVNLKVAAGAATDSEGETSVAVDVSGTVDVDVVPTGPIILTVIPPEAPDADGMLVFRITSNVELEDDLSINDIDIDTGQAHPLASGDLDKEDPPHGTSAESYTLTVNPKVANTDVLVEVRAGASMDLAEPPNSTPGAEATYTPEAPESDRPTVTIALPAGMTYVDSMDGTTVTITFNEAIADALVAGDITVTRGSPSGFSFDAATDTATLTVMPDIGATTVDVAVAADAVKDAADNLNVGKTETFNVGPTFNISANSILVITKTMGVTHEYLSDQPRLPINQQPPTPVADIETAVWENMPDLEVLFSLTGGGNGGTLNLTEAEGQDELSQTRDGGNGQKDSVRITEVMWAVDLSMRGALNDAEAAEQWIEITNATGNDVEVFLFARTGLDSAINVDDAEDRIGNAYDGGRGSASWTVPGQNGNSYTGLNFVSMHRKYDGSHNRGYVNGTSRGNWSASDREYLTLATELNRNDSALYNYVGSPGRPHSIGLPRPSTRAGVTQVPSSPVIINEVANRDDANAEYEWIELRNVTGDRVNLRNWMISMAYKDGDDLVDKPLVQFSNNNDAMIPANGVILLLATDPRYDDDHPIAVGYNVDVGENDQVDGLGLNVAGSNREPPLQKVFNGEHGNSDWVSTGGMPDNGDFILILRRHDNYEGHRANAHNDKGVAETSRFGDNPRDVDKIVDIAGSHRELDKTNYPTTNPAGLNTTTLWPLVRFNGDMRPHYGHHELHRRRHNRLEVNRVRYRQHVKTTAKNDADHATPGNRAGTGTTHKDENVGNYAMRDTVYTGLGYKRTARILRQHHGTPGYDGNSVGNTGIVKATAASSSVTISEIMYSTGPDADNPIYPQWVELYNSSPTNAVNLGSGWRLVFEMLDADGNPMDNLISLSFKDKGRVKTILPQQTVLVVAGNARQANSDSATGIDVFNDNRVFNVFRDIGAGKFGGNNGTNTRYMFFNPKAFNISLVDKDGKTVDSAGNLDGDDRTSDTNNWELPTGIAADGNRRTSIIRVYDAGVARAGMSDTESNVMPIFGTGDKKMKGADGIDAKYSWIPAVNTEREFKVTIKSTWFGDEDDYGTPNNRPGMVLPVQLSFFRPTLEDGEVTVRWTTESELDNAGFNIYRSETRDGEYKQVNTDMIQGAGTTGERTSYKWVDQTAKPGVVYYYQIEDVSFAGERQTLAITKLKGLISAKNKLTTRWGELKEVQ